MIDQKRSARLVTNSYKSSENIYFPVKVENKA